MCVCVCQGNHARTYAEDKEAPSQRLRCEIKDHMCYAPTSTCGREKAGLPLTFLGGPVCPSPGRLANPSCVGADARASDSNVRMVHSRCHRDTVCVTVSDVS